MKAHIVRIGNSRGVRLPKVLLEEAQLADEVELQAEPGRIVIRKAARPRAGWAAAARGKGERGGMGIGKAAGPRAGWAGAARRMRERDEDQLLDPTTPTRFDQKEWKWR